MEIVSQIGSGNETVSRVPERKKKRPGAMPVTAPTELRGLGQLISTDGKAGARMTMEIMSQIGSGNETVSRVPERKKNA
jgi:hypothetical protein